MKKMKKFISLLLVGIISINEFMPLVRAFETLPINNYNEQIDNYLVKGSIELELKLTLPIRNSDKADINFKITDENKEEANVNIQDIVNKAADGYLKESLQLGHQNIIVNASKRDRLGHLLSGIDLNNNIVFISVNIENLNKGTYHIELSGKNFITYNTDITLDDYSKRVAITNEKGLFTIGDVNNDNIVDKKDETMVLNAIENKNLNYDLNLDGTVDIADLNYITAIVNSNEAKLLVEDTNAILLKDNIEVDTNASVASGSLDTIFSDTGVVSLKQESEEAINVTLDIAKDDNPVDMSEVRIDFGKNVPAKAKLLVDTTEGLIEKEIDLNTVESDYEFFTDKANESTRVIDLGKKVAVKKVTIVISETGENNLADIAKVEFLNNVKVETKMPNDFYTPKNIKVDTSVSEQLTVTYENVPNVTGYEISINGGKINTIFQTTYTSFTIEDLDNYKTYIIQVRAVNGEWKSDWSGEIEAIPEATSTPPAVDMVVAKATYGGIDFSWKDMADTTSYNLYYRLVGETNWNQIRDINSMSYSLRNLLPQREYEAYLTGNNKLGEGSHSKTVKATTLELTATIYPKYRLINEYDGTINRTTHIKDVKYTIGSSYKQEDGQAIESDKWSMVDDNYLSYWEHKDWQVGAQPYNYGVPMFILDNTYKMDEFVITVPTGYLYSYKGGTYDETSNSKNDILLHYWNGEDLSEANKQTVQATLQVKTDKNNLKYYVMKLQDPIEANAIQFGLTVANNGKLIQIAEVKFYEYDSLVDDVAKLFTDDLRIVLADGVDINKINDLRKRADEQHNGEYNPYRDSIKADLDYAEKLLNEENLNDVITVDPNISNEYNKHLGFAMSISDYQPLGIAVHAGEQLTVYAGSTGKINVELVFTQNHAEANTWNSKVTLKKGQNVITVPQIGSAASERGGSVYVRFTSAPDPKNPIKIRVSGGTKIPVLDTTYLNNDNERKEAIKKYITELNDFVTNIDSTYEKVYKDFDGDKYSYEKLDSALGVTEIVTRHGLLSFSAEAVLDAINAGLSNEAEKINRLNESTLAFDEMMEMFYRHKGLELNASDSKNEIPKARVNIRYMQMFYGAFMYAGGYHVGIEYGSIAGVIQGSRNGYFGWGISHEVGHQINQSNLVHAEVTNNVYALLAQTANDKDESRLESSNIYEKIYNKVTSHTLGKDQNVFVTLGMYWQLHLAYDDNKTFDDKDSVFARINKYSRSYQNTQGYTKDELLILFASMAVEKDLSDYFSLWGIEAGVNLKAELSKYEKEDKAIYYLNDEARRYRINHPNDNMANDTKVSASIKNDNVNKRVTLEFNVNKDSNKILGYEIIRNGSSIAFVSGDVHSYTDLIGAENNRAYTYEVVAYDYLLNKTTATKLKEIKVNHDSSVSKNTFSIESNFKGKDEEYDLEDADMNYSSLSINKLIDGNNDTGFNGVERITTISSNNGKLEVSSNDSNSYVIINLNNKLSLSGIKYRGLVEDNVLNNNSIKNYTIYVSSDKVNWTKVRVGTFDLNSNNDYTNMVYFMKEGTTSTDQYWTYDNVSYIKIETDNKNGIAGSEIDLIAPPNDNIDFTMIDGNPSIGRVKEDYCYIKAGCTSDDEYIKAGSVVFEGSYTGNPSFNLLTITDASDGRVYGGYQLLFAEVNDDMTVYDVADGKWLYVMNELQYKHLLEYSTSIRANLYRVNDAIENTDSRLTSTTIAISNLKAYEDLDLITLTEAR